MADPPVAVERMYTLPMWVHCTRGLAFRRDRLSENVAVGRRPRFVAAGKHGAGKGAAGSSVELSMRLIIYVACARNRRQKMWGVFYPLKIL